MDESERDQLLQAALGMYANEPCRVCGKLLTLEKIKRGSVVFAGYSMDNKSRAMHRVCFETPIAPKDWKHP